jgi:D-alanyl-lipoteichoic acid acyltransferase DltB (MBOAT superfamily)
MPLSLSLALFVAVVVLLHMRSSGRIQNAILLAASYIFYASWDWRFLGLLWLMTAVTLFTSRRVSPEQPHARRYLYFGILFNLIMLGLFKYAGFFVTTANALLVRLGLSASTQPLEILLPIGISFYSFRLMSYLFDAHNRRFDPGKVSWLDFSLYVAFFPQIISGPIERAPGFLFALRTTRRLNQTEFIAGLTSIFIGLYYKIAIADPLAPIIDKAFNNTSSVAPAEAVAAIVLFSIQLYADFAGYSAIAIGISRWFGLPAMENFRQPYFAQSVIEFWTRWHISLSTWFRDYLFYPLSRSLLRRWGSKHTVEVQISSYLVTMLATGIWHGSNLTFAIWGLMHGIAMSIESVFSRIVKATDKPPDLWQARLSIVINILITQTFVSIAWVFFRAPSLGDGIQILSRALALDTFPDATWWIKILGPIGMILVIDLAQARTKNNAVLWQVNLFWRAALCAYILLALYIFGGKVSTPFVYFRF